MEKEPIYIFDSADKLLTILTEYTEAPFDESTEKEVSFEIALPSDVEGTEHIIGGNQVAFRDLEGRFRLFDIKETDDEDGSNFEKRAFCSPAINELNDTIVEDVRPENATAEQATTSVLSGTRFLVGNIASLGTQTTNFYYITAKQSLKKIVNVWGGELVDRIKIDDTGIAGRYIDIVYRRGADKGKRFEIDKDIQSIVRTVLHYPKTALYGRGSSIESGDGYSRKITFADIEWSTANGDPVDKPLGQEWVGDPEALQEHGIIQKDGSKKHREGSFEDGQEKDKSLLLQKTWDALQQQKSPKARYKMSVNTFYGIAGYEHEQVLLGDTGAIIDDKIKPPIVLESRVIRLKYDVGNPTDGEVTIGNFLELNKDRDRLNQLEETVNDKSGLWEQSETITDDSFPDDIPPVPTNFNANGLFKIIQLMWDYDPSSYIAAYEVYASQTAGFVPDSTNLVWKGKTGGYNHEAAVNQQWYFRIRAVNTHGTASAYSAEISAQTLQINASTEIAEETITKKLLAREALIDSIHIGNAVITDAKLDRASANKIKIKSADIVDLVAEKITGGDFTGKTFTGGMFEGSSIKSVSSSNAGYYTELINGTFVINRNDGNLQYRTETNQYGEMLFGTGSSALTSPGVTISPLGEIAVTNRVTVAGGTQLSEGRLRMESSNGTFASLEIPTSRYAFRFNDIVEFRNGVEFYEPSKVHVSVNPPTGDPLFRVLSSGNSERLRVEHNGVTSTSNSFHADGQISGNSISIGNGGITSQGYIETNVVDHNGIGSHLYTRPASDGAVRVTAKGTTSTYRPISASDFRTASLAEYKTNIELYNGNALDILKNYSEIHEYDLKNDIANGVNKRHLGFVIGQGYKTPNEVISEDGVSVSGYSHRSLNTKAIQELFFKHLNHEERISSLESRIEQLEQAA
ncbi:phage minor structural protein, N-terminal region [Virgibacillus subterraneus]|uniref:Phage minor structural protein, N-terminal region n=1 Tax=Virgibacillus subterraneus TaxID=621109 RepID=A0A1H9KMR1_9BACI|nr:phage tail spike protein [Virgibacillus subterraneus]SER00424.1 phage minor structural protein, N-terminal region [Virgibacillus subterraneus]